MTDVLSSCFAPFLVEMMSIKRNSGFSLAYMDAHIAEFDSFCRASFPDINQLDQELANAWIYATDSKSREQLRKRICTMRHLANHLVSQGIQAYLCPVRISLPKPKDPHVFTDEQLAEFFSICDSFEPVAFPAYRHIVLPVLFRTIYCCGLRNSEACNLRRDDVALSSGIMRIIGSKGHKDRVVYLHQDLQVLCRKYDSAMQELLPGREYFFPSQNSKHFINTSICRLFDQILAKTSFAGKTSKKPTCHGFSYQNLN